MEVTMTGWRIYYADGTTVDSSQMTWRDAPANGVQAIVVFQVDERDSLARMVLAYADLYWMAARYPEQGDRLPEGVLWEDVKVGSLLADDEWEQIRKRAWDDVRL